LLKKVCRRKAYGRLDGRPPLVKGRPPVSLFIQMQFRRYRLGCQARRGAPSTSLPAKIQTVISTAGRNLVVSAGDGFKISRAARNDKGGLCPPKYRLITHVNGGRGPQGLNPHTLMGFPFVLLMASAHAPNPSCVLRAGFVIPAPVFTMAGCGGNPYLSKRLDSSPNVLVGD